MNTNKMRNITNRLKSSQTIFMAIAGIIILVFLYQVYRSYKSYRQSSPYLISNTVEGSTQKVIPANQIADPSDGKYGQEFTYCTWLYIKDTNFTKTSSGETCNAGSPFRMIFNKGSNDFYSTKNGETNTWHYPTLSSPGVYLYPNTNKLNIRFNTYDTNAREKNVDIGNIPLNKWFMLTIVLIGNSVDIYINNMLKKREILGVIKLNYGDLHVGSREGFEGYLGNLRYFNRAVSAWEIEEMYNIGKDSEMSQPVTNIRQVANLSNNYYFTTGFPHSTFTGSS
jgi:hypothetical protein